MSQQGYDHHNLVRRYLDAMLAAKSDWVSAKELASEMNLSERSVKRLAAMGKLPKPIVNEGKIMRWHRAQFLQLIDRRR